MEAVSLEEGLGVVGELVGEEGDALEVFFAGEFDNGLYEQGSVALAAMVGMDDDVFHDEDKATHRGGHGEEQVGHSNDTVLSADDEDAAASGFFENVTNAFFL